MPGFSPTNIRFFPPRPVDPMFEAVEQSLRRPLSHARPWGPIRFALVAAVTFGVAPLVFWPLRLRQSITAQRFELEHLAEWLSRDNGKSSRLRQLALDVRPSIWMQIIPLALIAAIVLSFIHPLRNIDANGRDFLAVTYGYARLWSKFSQIPALGRRLFLTWTILLSWAYGFHWWMVQRQAAKLARFVDEFNALLASDGLEPVVAIDPGVGMRPMWIVLGLLGAWFGAIWAIPAALAGASHQQFLERAVRQTRRAMAERMCQLLANRQNA